VSEGGSGVEAVRGAWVLSRVGPHTKNARSTKIFSVFHHLQEGQTTQTTQITMWRLLWGGFD